MSRKPTDAVPPRRADQKPVRIAKAIARAGLTSRRDAERCGQPDPDHDVADLRDAVVGEQPLVVPLADGQEDTDHHRQPAGRE